MEEMAIMWNKDIFAASTDDTTQLAADNWNWDIRKSGQTVIVSVKDTGSTMTETEENTEAFESYIIHKEIPLSMVPAFPEIATVVTLTNPLSLSPGTKVTGFMLLPVLMQLIQTPNNRKQVAPTILKEVPSQTMSKTWFGTPVNGELCHAWCTELLTGQPECGKLQAIVPVTFENNSSSLLNINTLCLHTEFLELYITDTATWTNQINVIYRGENQKSSIILGENNPPAATGYIMKKKSRKQYRKGFVGKTFDVLAKHLAGM